MNIQLTVTLLVVALASSAIAQDKPRYSHTGSTLITGVRVIDGLGGEPKENQDVILINGKIASIGPAGAHDSPKNALVIKGNGMTAMPGLIDMHVHLKGSWANGTIPGKRYEPTHDDKTVQQHLSGHLYAGVTSVLDCGNDHKWILKQRQRIADGELMGPRFFAVGAAWSQEPSGWDSFNDDTADEGSTFDASTKVTAIAAIPGQMDRYKKDGIEIIKLYTGLSPHAAQFVVTEAHKRDIRVIADFWSLNMDKLIMQATGLDGWAHSAGFEIVSVDNNKWMADNNRFCIVTANVGEKLSGLRVKDEGGKKLMLKEPLIVDVWGKAAVAEFYAVYPQVRHQMYEGPSSFYQQNGFGDMERFRGNFLKNIKGAFDAGVVIAGGSDCPFPSLWTGEAMHREMQLFVMAGIEPVQAIKCCTYNAAKILRREKEFGSLQKGMSADLLIVEGNPAKDISDSRNVRHVFLRGNQVDRESLKLKN